MPSRVDIAPQLLRWARTRSGLTINDLAKGFPRLREWEAGTAQPTMRQVELYAAATHTPIGFLFLPSPPAEHLPIHDFRTFGNRPVQRPSPDLLDTIYSCELRQAWYRDYAEAHGQDQVEFVASLGTDVDPVVAAAQMRGLLGFEVDRRTDFTSWTDALSKLIEHAEAIGILVMVNGVVGSNTHRPLDPQEFRGFTLIDPYAPVVFINGADTKAAQIFTFAHELAHVASGTSGVSRPDLRTSGSGDEVERWCDRVAAELLVPLESIASEYVSQADLTEELDRLARKYRVSTLVVLRRIKDAGGISTTEFDRAYDAELARVLEISRRKSDGGNYYNTQPVRVSKTFARAVINDAQEGRTLYRDALRLLGSTRMSTFEGLSDRLGAA